MEKEELKNSKLAIYLLKDSIEDYKSSLKEDVKYQEFDFNKKMGVEGKVLIGSTRSNVPNWKEFIQEGIDGTIPELSNTSNRAIVFFLVDNRYFAIPFGYGKHLLKEESIEREFGLKTALNIINADKLLGIDKANIGDLAILTRTQASKKGTPEYFNIDTLKDLIRSVTGEPSTMLPCELGNIVTGNEGIYISPKTNIIKIPDILITLKQEYIKDTYKKRFDWIDNVKAERDPLVIENLKSILINELKNKNQENIHLAPPFILNWESFGGISYSRKGEVYYEFDIKNFYELKEVDLSELNWDKLIRRNLYIKMSTNDELIKFNLWRFINFETEYLGYYYVFTLSNWYKINKKYFTSIYEYCAKIEESTISFPDCAEKDEGTYNIKVANSNADFLCLDKELIHSDVSRSRIEACDIFTKSKEFIHIKFRDSSSTLSHLFAQGKVSGNSLRRDRTFRKNLRSKIRSLGFNSDLIALENKDFQPSDYTITYAIIEKKKRKFVDSLPFFSLINFRMTSEELMLMGFNIRVKKILIK